MDEYYNEASESSYSFHMEEDKKSDKDLSELESINNKASSRNF